MSTKRKDLKIADISGFPTTKGLFVDGEGLSLIHI